MSGGKKANERSRCGFISVIESRLDLRASGTVWRNRSGGRVEPFTIITTESNELVRPIHNRMPVILRPEDEEQGVMFSHAVRKDPEN